MATSGKKISEQAIADMLYGNELFPFALNGANGTATTDLLKQYVVDSMSDTLADFLTKPADGTSSQFLKADGSVDGNSYALSSSLGNYLPLTGGTVSGVTTFTSDTDRPIRIKPFGDSDWSILCFGKNNVGFSYNETKDSFYTTKNIYIGGWDNKIWHSGNDGTGSGLDADLLDGKHNGELSAQILKSQGTSSIAKDINVTGLQVYNLTAGNSGSLNSSDSANVIINITRISDATYSSQLAFTSLGAFYRNFNNKSQDTTTPWRQLAFTDSNVASADKLTTKQLTNEDLNTITNSFCVYYATIGNTVTNSPFAVGNFFNLQVYKFAGNRDVVQVVNSNLGIFKRHCFNDVWSSWQQLATTDGAVAKLTTKQLTNEDLNTIRHADLAVYNAQGNNSCANKPEGVYAFTLQVYGRTVSDVIQTITNLSTNTSYRRTCVGNTWSAWKKMLTEDDISGLVSRIEALENK